MPANHMVVLHVLKGWIGWELGCGYISVSDWNAGPHAWTVWPFLSLSLSGAQGPHSPALPQLLRAQGVSISPRHTVSGSLLLLRKQSRVNIPGQSGRGNAIYFYSVYILSWSADFLFH